MLRLNVAIPPASSPNSLGVVGGDLAGYPNGRRVDDDVVTIELRAVAGATIPLVDPTFTPDGAAGVVTDGTTDTNGADHVGLPLPGEPGWRLPDPARNDLGMMVDATSENPFAGQGSVLLDIGEDVGALVVTMPEATVGLEVEIRPVGAGGGHHSHATTTTSMTTVTRHLVHVAVVPRPVGDATVPSLVYPELVTGSYDVFEKGQPDAVALTVEVEGGRVTLADWPA